ncbi:MAG: hypothetical protein JWO99_228 [Candidatus Saccharibacteria bacterium]|nr:hypothetical protein [Candidatus Saccharibacteria bacterium]
MESDREIEAPTVTPVAPPRFSEAEERHIEVMMEVNRRLKDEERAQHQLTENELDADVEFSDTYRPRKKHIVSFLLQSKRRIGGGLLIIVALWALVAYVPSNAFDVQFGSTLSWEIGGVAVLATLLVIAVVFFYEIHNFMLWKNWKLEVTTTEVLIGQKSSILGRVDEDNQGLRRSKVEFVEVKRKWYLFFLDAYTVSFDAPTESDRDFNDMTFIRGGKLLKQMFKTRKG